jgi:hypothetical protein
MRMLSENSFSEQGSGNNPLLAQVKAGAYTRPLFSST